MSTRVAGIMESIQEEAEKDHYEETSTHFSSDAEHQAGLVSTESTVVGPCKLHDLPEVRNFWSLVPGQLILDIFKFKLQYNFGKMFPGNYYFTPTCTVKLNM